MINDLAHNLLGLVEAAGNRLLAMDELAIQRCTELQGRIVAIELSDLSKMFYFHPGSWGLRVSLQAPDREVDATIRGRLGSLISLSQQQDKISTSIQERIEISGDTRVARKFEKILTDLDIDWEDQLSVYTGDIAAYRIGQGLRKTRTWLDEALQSTLLSTREYLQEESNQLPTLPEFEAFSREVTELRHAVDRLEALLDHRFKDN